MIEPNENDNSLNVADEQELETDIEETPVDTEDVSVLKQKIDDLSGKNKRLFERTKKAEGEVKELKGKIPAPEKPAELTPQSNEPDYAKLAYLEAKGYNHPDDQKWILEEASRLKMPITDIINMEHVKTKLTTDKTQREALASMPKGRGQAGAQSQSDVDYWIAKGELPEDEELAAKVVERKMEKAKSGKMFSDEKFIG